MKRTTLLLLWLCTICFSAIRSDALTIPASEDSYTAPRNTLSYSTNNANSLIVDATRKSYLYFDLTDIPSDAVVRWAKLRLFLPTVRTAGAGLSVHLVTGTWNESTRLADVPSISAGTIGTIPPSKMASRRFVTVDVTGTVQQWINGGTLNEGFAVQPIFRAGSPTASVMLTSKEGPVFGLPAELDIEFQPEGGVNKPVALDQLPSPIQSLLIPTPPTLTSESQLPQSVRNLLGSLSGAFTPKITSQPSLSGGLLVSAENSLDPQIKYQWLRNGLPISTGTESSLRRAGLAGGTYQVRVSNTVSGTNSVSVVIPDNGHEVVFVPNTGVLFSKYETTVGQWKAFVEETGWNADQRWRNAGFDQRDDHPVVYVTSNHAQSYCDWLSSKTGKKWRLPNNEEWSLAAGNSQYPWGDNWPPSSVAGNYNFTQTGQSDWQGNPSAGGQWQGGGIDGFVTTAPVGSFASNFRGIFDLGGNVAEWTKSLTDPTLRGASWGPHTQQDLYTESIGIPIEVDTDAFRGFRIVRDWLNEGLVAHYPFNGNANDESGNGNHLHSNGASLTQDRFGHNNQAFRIENGEYLYNDQLSFTVSPKADFSYSMWFRMESFSSGYPQLLQINTEGRSSALHDQNAGQWEKLRLGLMVNHQDKGNVVGLEYGWGRGNEQYGWGTSGGMFTHSKNGIQTGVFTNITATVSAGTCKLYVNGRLESTEVFSSNAPAASPAKLIIGHWYFGFYADYTCDDVRIYNRALSEQEVKALYLLEKPETISTYQFVHGNFTWDQAKADAESKGGHLGVITSQAEWTNIVGQLGANAGRLMWIGAFQESGAQSVSSGWKWVTDELFDYTSWLPGEPNGYQTGFLHVNHPNAPYASGLWNDDWSGNAKEGYLLEIETNASDFVPTITAQPSTTGDLSVTALGANLKYQWSRNGVSVSGGTAAVLRRAGLSGGTYQVRVSNAVSGTNSVSVIIPDNGHQVVHVPNTNVMFSKHETTVGQWKAFVAETGWNKSDAWKNTEFSQADNEPVLASKNDALDYCAWLSAKTGEKWRLPTDSEWQFAAGTSTYPWGENYPPSGSDGNYSTANDPFSGTSPVGSFNANVHGLFDIGGNVFEWIADVDSLAGGSWTKREAFMIASSFRQYYPADMHSGDFGFRVVREIPELIKVSGGTLPASSPLGAMPVETFYIGRTEVTWKEWVTVRDWAVEHGYDDLAGVGQGVGDNYPVTHVNWYDVVKWCNARSEKEGKTPVYKNGTDVYRTGVVSDPQVGAAANGYRLPQEQEWEHAARGGTQTKGYTYSGSNNLDEVGWYAGNSGGAVHEVGKKLANELGLFDMSGNLLEWCWNRHQGLVRAIRGGGFNYRIEDCAISRIGDDYPEKVGNDFNGNPDYPLGGYHFSYGFRVALNGAPRGAISQIVAGSGLDHITFPHDPVMNTDVAKCTIEFWAKATSVTESSLVGVSRYRDNQEDRQLFVRGDGSVHLVYAFAPYITNTGPHVFKFDNKWHHVAFSRHENGDWRLYVDGKSVLNGNSVGPVLSAESTTYFISKGFILDEFRWSKTSRYMDDFTPTRYFESDSDTLMLLHFDEVDGILVNDSGVNKQVATFPEGKWVRVTEE